MFTFQKYGGLKSHTTKQIFKIQLKKLSHRNKSFLKKNRLAN